MAPRILLLLAAALLPALPAGAAGQAACPQHLTADLVDRDSVALDWEPAPGAVAYNIYRAAQGERLRIIAGVLAPQTDYQDDGVAPGRYRYMVTGYDELLGESHPCHVARVTVPVLTLRAP